METRNFWQKYTELKRDTSAAACPQQSASINLKLRSFLQREWTLSDVRFHICQSTFQNTFGVTLKTFGAEPPAKCLMLKETELSSSRVCCGPEEGELRSGALRPNLTSALNTFQPQIFIFPVFLVPTPSLLIDGGASESDSVSFSIFRIGKRASKSSFPVCLVCTCVAACAVMTTTKKLTTT